MRITPGPEVSRPVQVLNDDYISPLFQAVVEATEEAIVNSLFKATTMNGAKGRRVEALPLEQVRTILTKYGKIR